MTSGAAASAVLPARSEDTKRLRDRPGLAEGREVKSMEEELKRTKRAVLLCET